MIQVARLPFDLFSSDGDRIGGVDGDGDCDGRICFACV